jgi:hypothetical protein
MQAKTSPFLVNPKGSDEYSTSPLVTLVRQAPQNPFLHCDSTGRPAFSSISNSVPPQSLIAVPSLV